jgi:hypothetical protein
MHIPLTADERERRFVAYVLTLHKGQIGELRLRRMNEISNFRKALMQLVNELIEKRSEDLAAAMLMEFAPPRPKPVRAAVQRLLSDRKRVTPPWVKQQSRLLTERRAS